MDSVMVIINFLKLIVKLWKIVNVKCIGIAITLNNPLRAAVRSTCDHRLECLLKLVDIADGMTNSCSKRIHSNKR